MEKNFELKYYKWTSGDPCDRTPRQIKEKNNSDISQSIETMAYSTALNHDENSWEVLNPAVINYKINKREDIENKLSERSLITQTNMNPFMSNNNFSQDIDLFLKPQSTNLD